MTQLKLGLAQIDNRLGAVQENLERHLEWIERARREDVDLLVFPELSLTGYRLLHLIGHTALRPDTSRLIERLVEAAGDLSVVVGLVEEDDHSVTLEIGGDRKQIARRDIAGFTPPVSGMPPMGAALTPYQLRDLIEYLSTL